MPQGCRMKKAQWVSNPPQENGGNLLTTKALNRWTKRGHGTN